MSMSLSSLTSWVSDFWSMRDARERKLLTLCVCLIVGTLYYLLLIAPAVTGHARLNHELPALHQQVAQLQALANQAADLKSKEASPVAPLSQDSLAMALSAHGLKAKSLNISEQTTQLAMENVSYTQALALLDTLKQTMRIDVVDAKFTLLDKVDMINASLTLHQSGMP